MEGWGLEDIGSTQELALGEVYDRCGHVAYGLALRVLRDPQQAEAVVEDAFASLSPADGRSSAVELEPSTRVLTLVHARAVELRRTASTVLPQPTTQPPWGVARMPSLRALELLPDEQREILSLVYYDGFTLSKLAMELGRSRASLAATLRAALCRLQAALAEEATAAGAQAQAGPAAAGPAIEPHPILEAASLGGQHAQPASNA